MKKEFIRFESLFGGDNLARDRPALSPKHHGAARDLAHPPNPGRPLSASAHVKTACLDSSASCPLARNDAKVRPIH
jgi:hypothetical protein